MLGCAQNGRCKRGSRFIITRIYGFSGTSYRARRRSFAWLGWQPGIDRRSTIELWRLVAAEPDRASSSLFHEEFGKRRNKVREMVRVGKALKRLGGEKSGWPHGRCSRSADLRLLHLRNNVQDQSPSNHAKKNAVRLSGECNLLPVQRDGKSAPGSSGFQLRFSLLLSILGSAVIDRQTTVHQHGSF